MPDILDVLAQAEEASQGDEDSEDDADEGEAFTWCVDSPLPPTTTLEDARRYVQGQAKDGVQCPCCGLLVQVYKRSFNRGMARYLMEIVLEHQRTNDWVDVRRLPVYKTGTQRGDYGYLRWAWGLLDSRKGDDPSRRGSGLWRPTERGVAVARGEDSVWSHVLHVREHVLGFCGELITIHDVKKFDYRDLVDRGAWWVES